MIDSRIQQYKYEGKAKSVLRSLYFHLIDFISNKYPEHLHDDLLNSVAQQAFKFAYKTFAYTSDIGLSYMKEIAQALYTNKPEIFSRKFFIYSPELMMHLSKDYFSAGKYHIDCSEELKNYYTSWTPLFDSAYSQISFKIQNKIAPITVNKSSFILFPGNIYHKGNYNYTSKDHCALVIRITVDQPAHVGKYMVASSDINSLLSFDTSNYMHTRIQLSIIKKIYISTFNFLKAYLICDQKQPLIDQFISELPNSQEFNQFYRLYFGYSYFSDYINSVGCDSTCIETLSNYYHY